MRLIDADALYEKLKADENLARDRVIDTPNSFPNGAVNPSAIRYMAQLSERTRFKEIVYDAPTVDPVRRGEWIIEYDPGTGWYRVTCSECGENVTSTIPMIGFFPDAKPLWDFCPFCGAKMEEK